MNRYSRRDEFRPILILSGVGLLIAVITFLIIFFVYNKKVDSIGLREGETGHPSEIGTAAISNLSGTEDASFDIGRTVNEMQDSNNTTSQSNINNTVNTVTNTIENNTTNSTANNTNNNIANNTTNNTINNATNNTTTPAKPVKVADPTFKKPVSGKTILEYAKDNLVFSNTLQEWVTHLGIDISASEGTAVKASAEGTIDSVKNDPRYGQTVIIKHVNGYKTVYANLGSVSVKKGDSVKSGQEIGTVGKTAAFEIEDPAHLHFEITKNDVPQNPNTYLK